MRDVIVVGAGAGGPVVAKELGARGLDVLLLEAGPAWEDAEHQWSHYENEANNPATGIFRFGPGDRAQAPWARDLPQNSFIWQTAGVGGSTVHYFANSPRAMPSAFEGSLTYAELIPLLRMGRAHPARSDRGDGYEGGAVPARRDEGRAADADVQGHLPARL